MESIHEIALAKIDKTLKDFCSGKFGENFALGRIYKIALTARNVLEQIDNERFLLEERYENEKQLAAIEKQQAEITQEIIKTTKQFEKVLQEY